MSVNQETANTDGSTDDHFSLLDQVSPRLSPNNRRATAAAEGRKASVAHHSNGLGLLPPEEQVVLTSSIQQQQQAPDKSRRGAASAEPPVGASTTGMGPREEAAPQATAAHTAPRRTARSVSVTSNSAQSLYQFHPTGGESTTAALLQPDERDQLQTYWIDHDMRGADDEAPLPVFGSGHGRRRNPVRRFFVEYINLGVVSIASCVCLVAAGLVCRLTPDLPVHIHHDVGRFLLSAGIFGLASACSNFVAVRVLLLAMFLSRHESVLQNSVRDIVMNIFFSKDAIETELVAHIRKTVSTTSVAHTVRQVASHDRCMALADQYLDHFLGYTKEGILLGMLGVSKDKLKPLMIPAVLAIVADLTPLLSDIVKPSDLITTDAFYDAMERIVSQRTASLDIKDLKGIVSGVLSPHLSILVLWGSLFGVVLGIVAEVFTLSHFLSGCTDDN